MTREQGTGFGQLYFSLLMSVFSVHLLTTLIRFEDTSIIFIENPLDIWR
ncbi:MAG: hypothetical protein ACK6A9_00450 [Dolichospermum sp.]